MKFEEVPEFRPDFPSVMAQCELRKTSDVMTAEEYEQLKTDVCDNGNMIFFIRDNG